MQYAPPGIITYLFSRGKACQKGDFNIRDLQWHMFLEKLACKCNLLFNWKKGFHSLCAFKRRKLLKLIRQTYLFHKATAAQLISQISQLQNKFLIVHVQSSLTPENAFLVIKLRISRTCSDSKLNLCAKFLPWHTIKETYFSRKTFTMNGKLFSQKYWKKDQYFYTSAATSKCYEFGSNKGKKIPFVSLVSSSMNRW